MHIPVTKIDVLRKLLNYYLIYFRDKTVRDILKNQKITGVILFSVFITISAKAQISFPSASAYRYLKGIDAASLDAGWMNPGFDDSSWDIGNAPFWYGDGSGGTELTDMINNYSTLYLRSTFNATDAVNIQEIQLLIDFDDGFVIWINGVEALAVNAPAGYAYNGFAPENHESGTSENFNISTDGLNLQEGTNTIAVQGFNVSLTSSDFHFECSMTATPEIPVLPDGSGIVFSQPSGYYTNPFSLTITSPDPGATLLYTLDGTDPRNTSTGFTAGVSTTISINPSSTTGRGTTPGVVVRASITKSGYAPSYPDSRTYIFMNELRTQSYPGWDWPSDDVWGITLSPSDGPQIIDYDMDPDVINDSRYTNLIDDAFLDIPTLSIATDNRNLFDPTIGIYVNGYGEGIEWERECNVELINPGGSEGFDVNAGIRIRGGWSRHPYFPKHSFRLFFRSEYGNAKLEFPLFGSEGVDHFDKVDIRTSQNYAWSIGLPENTMVREVFSRDSQRDTEQPYTRSRYYHLFINGMYWGLFQTQERSEARYASDYFGDNAEDYDVIKVNTDNYQIEATDGNDALWRRLYSLCSTGFADNSSYFALEGKNENGWPVQGGEILVDIDNLIDYMIGIFYTGNFDAPTSSFGYNKGCNNFYAIIDRDDNDKGFVFFNHDAEHSMFYYAHSPGVGYNEDRVNIGTRTDDYRMEVSGFYSFHPQWLHFKLSENEEYRLRFADRAEMRLTGNGVYTEDRCRERFLNRASEIDMAIIAESARWGDGMRSESATPYTKDDNWEPEINNTTDMLMPSRTNTTINQLRQAGLYPDLDAPEIIRYGNVLLDDHYQLTNNWQITIRNPNSSGQIYYTTDNHDPRNVGGGIYANAIEGTGEIVLDLESSTIIKARIYDNGEWSTLKHIDFLSGSDDLSNLKITEINYHPVDLIEGNDTIPGKDFEFIEFKNIGETSLNLSGIVVDSAVYYVFPSNTLLAPGKFYVITSKPSKFYKEYGKISSGNFQGNLSNSGEQVLVKSSKGVNLINFSYADSLPWPERPDGDGPTLVSVEFNPTGDPGTPSYWRASYHNGGSPFSDDVLFPQFIEQETASADEYSLRIYPNPTHSILNIEVTSLNIDNPIQARLYTLNGELIYETEFFNTASISCQSIHMSSGLYILSVRSGNWIKMEKIVFNP